MSNKWLQARFNAVKSPFINRRALCQGKQVWLTLDSTIELLVCSFFFFFLGKSQSQLRRVLIGLPWLESHHEDALDGQVLHHHPERSSPGSVARIS